MTYEHIIDKRIAQAVQYHKGSDASLKRACIAASGVVGNYDGTTQEIAKQSRRSVSTVENWANAHKLYKAVRANGNRAIARQLWRELPATHWWMAWDIHRNGYDALYYLLFAFQNHVSGRGMMGEYSKDVMAGNAPLVLQRAKIAIFGLASELRKRYPELTPLQRAAVDAVLKAFEVKE